MGATWMATRTLDVIQDAARVAELTLRHRTPSNVALICAQLARMLAEAGQVEEARPLVAKAKRLARGLASDDLTQLQLARAHAATGDRALLLAARNMLLRVSDTRGVNIHIALTHLRKIQEALGDDAGAAAAVAARDEYRLVPAGRRAPRLLRWLRRGALLLAPLPEGRGAAQGAVPAAARRARGAQSRRRP